MPPPRTGRYSIKGEGFITDPTPAVLARPESASRVPHAPAQQTIAEGDSGGGYTHIDKLDAEIHALRNLISTANNRITALENERFRDSQSQLEEELEKAKEILKERDERSRHWTRWAAQVVVSLIIGAILLLVGRMLSGGAKHGRYAPGHDPHPGIVAVAVDRGADHRPVRPLAEKRASTVIRPKDPTES